MGFNEDLAAMRKGAPSGATTQAAPVSGGFDADLEAMRQQPVITESVPHQNAPAGFDLGLAAQNAGTIAAQLGGNFVEGAAKGIQSMDTAMMNASKQLLPNMPHPAENDVPIDIVSPVHEQYKGAIEGGQREHPILSHIAQQTGQLLPTIPAWETGAGAAGSALSFLPRATGPLGGKLLQLASQMPQALQNILKLTATGTTGAFTAGMQESVQEQMQKPNTRPNLLEAVKHGAELAAQAAPAVAGLGVIGEGVAKGLGKVAELRLTRSEKAAQELEKQQLKAQQELQKQQNEYNKRIEESDRTRQAAEEMYLEERINASAQKAEYYRQQAIDEMKMARKAEEELRQARSENIKNKARRNLSEYEERARVARERADAFNKQYEAAIEDSKRELLAVQKERIAKQQLRMSQESDAANARKGVGQGRAEYFQDQHAEGAVQAADELRAWQGTAADTAQAREASRAAQPAAPKPEFSLRSKTLATPEDAALNSAAEARALSFAKKPAPGAEPPAPAVEASPATMAETAPVQTGPSSFSLSARAQERMDDAKVVHSLEKGRGNAGRKIFEEENPEYANRGFFPEDWSEADIAEARAAIAKLDENGSLMVSGVPSLDVAALQALLHKIPKSELNYDGIMHALGVQRTSDIFRQYEPLLAEAFEEAHIAMGAAGKGLRQMFNEARGKLSFAQMGAGKIEPEILSKGIRGHLAEDELRALPEPVQRAIKESRAVLEDYKKQLQPVKEFLDTFASELPTHSGLGRLRTAVNLHWEDTFGGGKAATYSNTDKVTSRAVGGLMTSMFLAKAANAFIHAAEKGVALFAKEGPISLTGAIAKAYKPGAHKKFVDEFLSGAEGPLTEAFEDTGIKLADVASSKFGRIASGRAIEQSPNRVATVMGLDRAAKNLGYKNGDELAEDILAAREGKGPLAYDSKTLSDAMEQVQTYVSDVTGMNTPGFRDQNVFQRGTKTMKAFNLFLTMPTVQSRNFHNLIRELSTAQNPKQHAIALTKIGAYLFALEVTGDKNAIPKDLEPAMRDLVGAPNWYKFMDTVRETRKAIKLDEVPSIPHLQQSMSPAIGGGASVLDIARTSAAQGIGSDNPEARARGAILLGGMIGASSLFGKVGTNVVFDYGKAVRDGLRGYSVEKIYSHEYLGGEKHVADIPHEIHGSNDTEKVLNAILTKWSGTHSKEAMELIYNAEKTQDLREWVRRNATKEWYKEALEDERQMDELAEMKELNDEKNETLNELYEQGYKENSPEAEKVKEEFNAKSVEHGKLDDLWKLRSIYWQQRADELMKELQPPAQTPVVSSSSKET
jgi:hypothetical protein